MKPAAGYIRVSTQQQAEEDKVSLDEQRQDIEAYAASKGYTVVKWYSDVGSGASKRRPQFQQLLREISGHLTRVPDQKPLTTLCFSISALSYLVI